MPRRKKTKLSVFTLHFCLKKICAKEIIKIANKNKNTTQ